MRKKNNNMETVRTEIEFIPKVHPEICCPMSVFYLPAVVAGIENGEIIVKVNGEKINNIKHEKESKRAD